VKLSRKFMMAGASLSLLLGTVALTGVGIAAAKGAKPAAGTVSCTGAKGSVSFKPALTTAAPYTSEKATVKVTFSGCTGSVTTPHSGSIKATLSSISTDQCPPPAAGGSGGTLTVKWSPTTIQPSAVSFSSKESTTGGPNNDFGFVYPAPGGTSSVAGSYEGTDSGASSSASVYSNVTESTLLSQCSSKKGLKKLTIVSGSISLG
jgi:hypothetical protein